MSLLSPAAAAGPDDTGLVQTTLLPGLLIMAFAVTMIWLVLTSIPNVRKLQKHGTAVPGILEAPVGARRTSVRVRFYTRDGHEVSVIQNLVSPTRIPAREVTVHYDPDDPRRAHASGVRDSLPVGAYAAMVVFLVFFLIGLGLVVLSVLSMRA